MPTKDEFDPKEFMGLMKGMVRQNLDDFRQEIKREVKVVKKERPFQELIDNQLLVDVMATGGTPESRQSFIQEIGPLMIKYGVVKVWANLTKKL